MEEKNKDQFVRTTLYINRRLHEKAKIMSVLTRTSLSQIMCIALREKIDKIEIKEMKEEKNG